MSDSSVTIERNSMITSSVAFMALVWEASPRPRRLNVRLAPQVAVEVNWRWNSALLAPAVESPQRYAAAPANVFATQQRYALGTGFKPLQIATDVPNGVVEQIESRSSFLLGI